MPGITGINALKNEHRLLTALVNEIPGILDPTTLEDRYADLRAQFEVHAAIELEAFWPFVNRFEETMTMAAKAAQEWNELCALFAEIDELPMNSPRWKRRFESVRMYTLEHFELEEKQIFDFLESRLDARDSQDLSARIATAAKKYGY